MTQALPVAFEVQDVLSGPFKSISESGILAAAAQASRLRWLTAVLPIFSHRPKAGALHRTVSQQTHNLTSLGRCDLSIGPHLFPRTEIFELEWTGPPAPELIPNQMPPMTPTLTEKLQVQAAKDPVLGQIMQRVEQRIALPHEITAFTKYTIALAQTLAGPAGPRPNSLVIEFRDNSADRFAIPATFAWLSTKPNEGRLSFALAVPKSRALPAFSASHSYLIEVEAAQVSDMIAEAFTRLAAKDPIATNEPPRSYLQLQTIELPTVPILPPAPLTKPITKTGPKLVAGKASKTKSKSSGPKTKGKPGPKPKSKAKMPGQKAEQKPAGRPKRKLASTAKARMSPDIKDEEMFDVEKAMLEKEVDQGEGSDELDAIKARPTARQMARKGQDEVMWEPELTGPPTA